MERLPVYVLAGGRSQRFGSDKARAMLHGLPLIVHVAHALRPLATSISVVADREGRYEDLALRTIADFEAHRGPLGGLLSALEDSPSPWIVLAPCDAGPINPAWIEALAEHRSEGTHAVAFRHTRWEPLPALYHKRLIPLVRTQLQREDRSLQSLLDVASTRAVDPPSEWPERPGINTREDLDALAVRTSSARGTDARPGTV